MPNIDIIRLTLIAQSPFETDTRRSQFRARRSLNVFSPIFFGST
jgi:hypothetical protein